MIGGKVGALIELLDDSFVEPVAVSFGVQKILRNGDKILLLIDV
jgi:hypothetical protein